jgi:acyl carrier protein|tara:strand:- start:811 stop:1065 length:255 start_codon:yes stop_codon:yes gene_type:complete
VDKIEILERVQEIFRDVFDDENLNIKRDNTAADIEDWDSLANINLVVAMEKEFNIKYIIEEIQVLRDVGDMIDLIYKKLELDNE